MTVTQRLMKPGRWHLELVEDAPRSITSAIELYDHIVITPTRLSPIDAFSDANILSASVYTGPIITKPSSRILEGYDNSFWLGTPDGLGDILDTAVSNVAGSTLSTWITSLKPISVSAGTVTNAGTTTRTCGPFQWVTRREAISSVCQSMGAEWRVNPNFTLDVGTSSNLFVSAPTVVVTRRVDGQDGAYRGLDGKLMVTKTDVEQYTTKTFAIAQGPGTVLAAGTATSGATTYKDGLNNAVVMERIVNAPTDPAANSSTTAAAVLGQFSSARFETTISSKTYDIPRFTKPGDTVYIWDLLSGMTDTANQITYRGETITPKALRVFALTWPVERGMGVYIRRSGATPVYTDITDYVQWEDNTEVQWEIGRADSAVSNDTSTVGSVATLGAQKDLAVRMAGFGPLLQYTSTVVQGATPTQQINDSKYTRSGRWIQGSFDVSVSAGATPGTAATTITITLPVTAGGGTQDAHTHLGQFRLEDFSTGALYQVGQLVLLDSTHAVMCVTAQGSVLGDVFLGSNTFTAALAQFDRISGSFAYEAAAD